MARTFHSDSRTWSNFQPEELVKLTGVSMGRWPEYLLKESLDNSAAALEEHDVENGWIRVEMDDHYVRISDSGPGISDWVLDHILDFDKFGGSNRHHKLPTRGAQGNAIMTLVGIVTAWSNDNMEIHRPCGPAIELSINLDPIQQSIAVERIEIGEPGPSCLVIPLPKDGLPYRPRGTIATKMLAIAKMFAWMNPHISFMIRDGRKDEHALERDPIVKRFEAIPGEIGAGPVMPNAKCGSVTWFSEEEFAERLAADIRARPETTVMDWAREFAFEYKFKMMGADTRPISELADKGPTFLKAQSARLQFAITAGSHTQRAQKPGFELLESDRMASFLRWHGADKEVDAEYHHIRGIHQEIPFAVEVCLVQMPKGAKTAPAPILAMNRTVLYGSPSFKRLRWREKVRGQWHGTRGDLSILCQAYEIDRGKTPAAILVHAISPSPGYSGYGKQNFNADWLQEAVSVAMEKVTLRCRKQRAGELRRTSARVGPKTTIRQDLFDLLPGAVKRGTKNGKVPILVRQLYYNIRPHYFRLRPDKAELHYGTFCVYLDEYEQNVVGDDVCLRDPRGTMYEPHSGRTLRLGTADVRKFNVKKWEGHTIIFVEKENLASLMRSMGVHRRWDAIIIGSKGFAVESIREVLQKYKQLLGGMVKVVCLHDADPAGYLIGYDLANNLPRFGNNVDVQVIDVGLSVEEAYENDWPDEPFKMPKSTWSMINNMHFGNKKNGKPPLKIRDPHTGEERPIFEPKAWDAFMPPRFRSAFGWDSVRGTPIGRRVELNAIGNGDPTAFCDWVEAALERHGCKKVRPPDEIVDEKLKTTRENLVSNEVGSYLMGMLGNDVVLEIMAEVGIPAMDLDAILEAKREQHWSYLTEKAAKEGIDLKPIIDRVMRRKVPQLFESM